MAKWKPTPGNIDKLLETLPPVIAEGKPGNAEGKPDNAKRKFGKAKRKPGNAKRKPTLGNIDKLLQTLPPIIARNKIAELTGGLIAKGTMQNFDSEGKGPPRIVLNNRRSGYIREDFVEWLKARIFED